MITARQRFAHTAAVRLVRLIGLYGWLMLALLSGGCGEADQAAAQAALANFDKTTCLDGGKYKGPQWLCVPTEYTPPDPPASQQPPPPDTCVPKCDGKVCGDNGCGGSCGVCTGAGFGCSTAGQCTACVPDCSGKQCGSDGCGGVCGKCTGTDTPFCSATGQCTATCVPKCLTNGCGSDGCGGSCGTCGEGKSCLMQQCVATEQVGSCKDKCGSNATGNTCSCSADCVAAGNCCPDFASVCGCVPDCKDKSCGSDGCGGSCGSCAAGKLCGGDFACKDDLCDPDPCGGRGSCNPDNGACTCKPEFAGTKCDSCAEGLVGFPTCGPSPCTSNTCNGQGSCSPTTGACTCNPAFTGPTCKQCKSPAEVWPDCTCTGDNCGGCTAKGCDDGNPCTVDGCDASGACLHDSPCSYGVVQLAKAAAFSGAKSVTEAAPLQLQFPGSAGVTASVWRAVGSGQVSLVQPLKNKDGGPVAGVKAAGDYKVEGPVQLLQFAPGLPDAATITVAFAKPASALGAGKRYVVGVSGLGGPNQGPSGAAVGLLNPYIGHLPVWDGAVTAMSPQGFLEGKDGGQPSALELFVLADDALSVEIYNGPLSGPFDDTFEVVVGVIQLTQQCEASTGTCGPAAAKCGDGSLDLDEGCDDGNVLGGDGCNETCQQNVKYNCINVNGKSRCGLACTKPDECAGLQVFWNALNLLTGLPKDLEVGKSSTALQLQIPYVTDVGSTSAGVTVSLQDTGVTGAPDKLTFQTYSPPAASSAKLVAPEQGKTFVWTDALPYLDILPGGPLQHKLRYSLDKSANELGEGWRYVLGVAGTSGDPSEGPVTIVSSVALEDMGTLDAFDTGKYPTLQNATTLVGSKELGTAYKADGYRFVLLPMDAKLIDLTITSPADDPHGYAIGLVRTKPQTCVDDMCVAVPAGCGDALVASGEACDDGNTVSGDGCSALCTAVENGWTCVTKATGSLCTKNGGCIANCAGKGCGDDGCGGSCGSCDPGQQCSGTGTCVDDPCQPDPCSGNGSCNPATGACTCQNSYAGATCNQCAAGLVNYPACTAPDLCAGDPCSGNGSCNPATGACTCQSSYAGATCNQCAAGLVNYPACTAPDLCAGDPCNGHGSCNPATGACTCDPAFAGSGCASCKFETEIWPNCTCAGDKCPDCEVSGCDDANGCTSDTCNPDGNCTFAPQCGSGQVMWVDSSPLTEPVVVPLNNAAELFVPTQPPLPVIIYRPGDWLLSPGLPLSAATASMVEPYDHPLAWSGTHGTWQLSSYLNGGTEPAEVQLAFAYPAVSLQAPWPSQHRYVIGIAGLSGVGGPTAMQFSADMQEVGRLDWDGSSTPAVYNPQDRTLLQESLNPSQMQFFMLDPNVSALTVQIGQMPMSSADQITLVVGLIEVAYACVGSGPGAQCASTNTCGDGLWVPDEGCDDGNLQDGDGCNFACQKEANQICSVPVITSVCTAGPPVVHPCDAEMACMTGIPDGYACLCSPDCKQFGNCCQFDGSPGATCAGSTCGACQ